MSKLLGQRGRYINLQLKQVGWWTNTKKFESIGGGGNFPSSQTVYQWCDVLDDTPPVHHWFNYMLGDKTEKYEDTHNKTEV